MKNSSADDTHKKEETRKMVETYYKKIMRIVEYYVLLSFILITFVPLLNFSWVQSFIYFIFFTGFPLLILLFVVSMVKEPVLSFFTKILEK